jgi:uncharacterized protein (DUF58 family)
VERRPSIARLLRPRTLRFTREGKYFVALCLGIGFAAINTGNNLLFLILGMMLTLIIGSGVLSEVSLRTLSAERQIPDRVFANRPFLMGISLHNGKHHLPSFSVEVEDLLAERSLDKKCYFLKVPAGRRQHTSYRHTFHRRGLYRFSGFRISTKFPFALFRKSRASMSPVEIVVFPAVYPVLPPGPQATDLGETSASRGGRRGDFHSLRQYQAGDDPRGIHWRKSARLGRLMVRLNEEPTSQRIAILLDNLSRTHPAPTGAKVAIPDVAELERQEHSVSQAASLAVHYIKRGYVVRLVTRTVSVGPGAGQPHLTSLLRALALLEFVTEELPFAAPARWTGEYIFVGGGPPRPQRSEGAA